jgi:hypothetical protein
MSNKNTNKQQKRPIIAFLKAHELQITSLTLSNKIRVSKIVKAQNIFIKGIRNKLRKKRSYR